MEKKYIHTNARERGIARGRQPEGRYNKTSPLETAEINRPPDRFGNQSRGAVLCAVLPVDDDLFTNTQDEMAPELRDGGYRTGLDEYSAGSSSSSRSNEEHGGRKQQLQGNKKTRK